MGNVSCAQQLLTRQAPVFVLMVCHIRQKKVSKPWDDRNAESDHDQTLPLNCVYYFLKSSEPRGGFLGASRPMLLCITLYSPLITSPKTVSFPTLKNLFEMHQNKLRHFDVKICFF